jgi:branched-chain amino acid transport system substrate-binding protein
VEIVYDQGVPTETSNYTVIVNSIRAMNPDALIELGYPANDIAFLRNIQDSGIKFKMLFTVYAGMETETLVHNVGEKGLANVFTYVTPAQIAYRPDFGLSLEEYRAAWSKKYPDGKLVFGYNAVGGYHTGLVLEKALAVTESLDQLDLRKAIFSLSGKLRTLDGTFALDATGAQVGIILPVGQIAIEDGRLKLVVVSPHDVATGKPVYPAP